MGSFMTPHPAVAGDIGTVNISPQPLLVAGTVQAKQSGLSTIGIAGTPSVNLANTSAVNLPAGKTDKPKNLDWTTRPIQIEKGKGKI